jgi:A/G-specific adenine glycosylase
MPWRETQDPYRILISEFMLQQTGVGRVLEKYRSFLEDFPDLSSLAEAPLERVLSVWQGLGYNRRAVSLRECAKIVVEKHGGVVPDRLEILTSLPGIGPATGSAVLVFAFGKPEVFIETNVRRVFLHFFFRQRTLVRDSEILRLIDRTLDRKNPRDWYYALMDYGALLGKTHPLTNRRSAHYRRQPSFEGSDRQVRGRILRMVLARGAMTEDALSRHLGVSLPRISRIVAQLSADGILGKERGTIAVR